MLFRSNDTATTEIYTLSLHDALPIWIEETSIETVVTTVNEKVPISDKIIEYLSEHEFDFLLLCKHNKKKSEEFLFGDTAIQVLRKTTIPLLIVKGTGEPIA